MKTYAPLSVHLPGKCPGTMFQRKNEKTLIPLSVTSGQCWLRRRTVVSRSRRLDMQPELPSNDITWLLYAPQPCPHYPGIDVMDRFLKPTPEAKHDSVIDTPVVLTGSPEPCCSL